MSYCIFQPTVFINNIFTTIFPRLSSLCLNRFLQVNKLCENKVYLRVAVVSNNINWWYFWTGTIRAEHPCAYKWREIFRLFLWYFSCRSKILSYIEIPGQANGIKIYTLFCPWSCYDPYTFKLVTIWPMGCLLFLKNCSFNFSFLYLFIFRT